MDAHTLRVCGARGRAPDPPLTASGAHTRSFQRAASGFFPRATRRAANRGEIHTVGCGGRRGGGEGGGLSTEMVPEVG